jgi:hypothetical protein
VISPQGSGGVAPPLELLYATSREGELFSQVTIADILAMIFVIDSLSAGEMTSKQQSHFPQRQM